MEGGKTSRTKIVADELLNYLLYKYSQGEVIVSLPEVEDHIFRKYRNLFGNKRIVATYMSRVVRHLQRYGVLSVFREVGEQGYKVSLTLYYLQNSMYNPRRWSQ